MTEITETKRSCSTRITTSARAAFEASEGSPLFRADWSGTMFLHFRVPATELQPYVPYELDTYAGWAYVSFVAFTLENMRLGLLPISVSRPLLRTFAPCRFLNLRTYVKGAEGLGIFFLAEWLSNQAAVPFGRPLFGLPYRAGELNYGLKPTAKVKRGRVASPKGALLLFGGEPELDRLAPAVCGTLDEFLLERYTAYTEHAGFRRYFRVWHPAWAAVPCEVELSCASLLTETGEWCHNAQYIGAHYSPGVEQVWMGRPHFLPTVSELS